MDNEILMCELSNIRVVLNKMNSCMIRLLFVLAVMIFCFWILASAIESNNMILRNLRYDNSVYGTLMNEKLKSIKNEISKTDDDKNKEKEKEKMVKNEIMNVIKKIIDDEKNE